MHLVCEAEQPAEIDVSQKMTAVGTQNPFNESIVNDPPKLEDKAENLDTENGHSMENINGLEKETNVNTDQIQESNEEEFRNNIGQVNKIQDPEVVQKTNYEAPKIVEDCENNSGDAATFQEPEVVQKTNDDSDILDDLEINAGDAKKIKEPEVSKTNDDPEKSDDFENNSGDADTFQEPEVIQKTNDDSDILDDLKINAGDSIKIKELEVSKTNDDPEKAEDFENNSGDADTFQEPEVIQKTNYDSDILDDLAINAVDAKKTKEPEVLKTNDDPEKAENFENNSGDADIFQEPEVVQKTNDDSEVLVNLEINAGNANKIKEREVSKTNDDPGKTEDSVGSNSNQEPKVIQKMNDDSEIPNDMEINAGDANKIVEPEVSKINYNLEQHDSLENNACDNSNLIHEGEAATGFNNYGNLQSDGIKTLKNYNPLVGKELHAVDGLTKDNVRKNVNQGPEENIKTGEDNLNKEMESEGIDGHGDIEPSKAEVDKEDNNMDIDENISHIVMNSDENGDKPNNDENRELDVDINIELNCNKKPKGVLEINSNNDLNKDQIGAMADVIYKNYTEGSKDKESAESNSSTKCDNYEEKDLKNNNNAHSDVEDCQMDVDRSDIDVSESRKISEIEIAEPNEECDAAKKYKKGMCSEDFVKSTEVQKDTNEDKINKDQNNCNLNSTLNTDKLVKEEEIMKTRSVSSNVDDTDVNKDDTSVDNTIIASVEQSKEGDRGKRKDSDEKKTSENQSLDILSDDEESRMSSVTKSSNDHNKENNTENHELQVKESVTVDDDDDIMVVDDKNETTEKSSEPMIPEPQDKEISSIDGDVLIPALSKNDSSYEPEIQPIKTQEDNKTKKAPTNLLHSALSKIDEKPLVAVKFMESLKTKLGDMTRADLEEFCLLKIVEGVVDRSNLSEIKGKVKSLTQTVEEWRKKAMVLNKQHRDLQIVLRTVQEEQKKRSGEVITPLRITRSVGMQVVMTENKAAEAQRARPAKRNVTNANNANKNTPLKNATPPISKVAAKQPIPVPRLVPLTANTPSKAPRSSNTNLIQNAAPNISSNTGPCKSNTPPNRMVHTQPKQAEKRPHSNVSIDLTDDEPPSKQIATGKAVQPPVRLVPAQQLMAQNRAPLVNHGNQNSNPRQVYIPISGNQSKIRPGQSILFKTMSTNARPRQPSIIRNVSPVVRPGTLARGTQARHPAPLPHAVMQSTSPNWKSLPPAPDLKISKVENGIVISWKMDGYQEDSFEEIASYQLFAYQETSSPPSTMLWKKIGDVKALPLPMACTLTQFMAGYKYYFAVRAVDIRSRIGPFSLPGSILLLNK